MAQVKNGLAKSGLDVAEIAVLQTAYYPVQVVQYTPKDQWLRLSNVCVLRELRPHTVRSWVKMKKFPVLIMDGIYFVTLEDIDRFLNSREQHSK